MKNNYALVKDIVKRIKDESIRHEIIFLDTVLGSYEARESHPDDFTARKPVSGPIREADYIAKRREVTTGLLDKKSPEEILKFLSRQVSELDENNIAKDGLYNMLGYFIDGQLREIAGERLETRLLSWCEYIGKGASDREEKKALLNENSAMYTALRDKFQRMRDH